MTTRVNKKTTEWKTGDIVKIGFLTLTVTGLKFNNKHWGQPNGFELESSKGVKYEFIPHQGLHRI